MKIRLNGLAMILNLLLKMMYLAGARSLPSMQRTGESWQMTRREVNSESPADVKTVSEATQFQTELANLSIPSYLKDIYMNLTYPNGVARPSSNHEEMKANTIQSYINQAKSKLFYLYKHAI